MCKGRTGCENQTICGEQSWLTTTEFFKVQKYKTMIVHRKQTINIVISTKYVKKKNNLEMIEKELRNKTTVNE